MGWGSAVKGFKAGIWWSTPPAVTKADTSVTLTAYSEFYRAVSLTDTSNTTTWSGAFSNTRSNINFSGGKGTQEFDTSTMGFPLNYGSSYEATINLAIAGIEYVGTTLYASDTVTIPARPFQTPAVPKNFAVVKNSDTSFTCTWTADKTDDAGGYPWHSLLVERWDNVTAGWYQIAALSGGALSYTDTSTQADREYKYRVKARNTSGDSTYATSGSFYTTPAAHKNFGWLKSGGDVVLSWTKLSTMAVSTQVWEAFAGGTYALLATVSGSSYTHVSPSNAGTHQYKVRPVISGVTGAYIESTVVQLLAAPLAPTGLAPNGATVDNQSAATACTWQHNATDGTGQSVYEFQYRVDGGSWVNSGTVTSGTSSRTIAAGTWAHGKTIGWQVRTKGAHADWSPWSAIATFPTGARPTATITSPSTSHGASVLSIGWTYYDPESTAQAEYRVTLLDSTGATLHTSTQAGTATSYPVPVPLTNSTSYTATVEVRDGSGLWSAVASKAFSTDFLAPPAALLTLVWDRDLGTVQATIDNAGAPLPDSYVPAVYNRLWRSVDGGADWELVADNVPLDTTVTDWTPAVGATVHYRAETVSATPTSAFSTSASVWTTSPWVFVNGGPNGSIMARLKGNTSVGASLGREKVIWQFAGRRYPVEFVGEARTTDLKVTGSADGWGLTGNGTWRAWETVADLPAPLLYRDPMGRRFACSIGDVDITHDAGSKFAKVSFTVRKVAS